MIGDVMSARAHKASKHLTTSLIHMSVTFPISRGSTAFSPDAVTVQRQASSRLLGNTHTDVPPKSAATFRCCHFLVVELADAPNATLEFSAKFAGHSHTRRGVANCSATSRCPHRWIGVVESIETKSANDDDARPFYRLLALSTEQTRTCPQFVPTGRHHKFQKASVS